MNEVLQEAEIRLKDVKACIENADAFKADLARLWKDHHSKQLPRSNWLMNAYNAACGVGADLEMYRVELQGKTAASETEPRVSFDALEYGHVFKTITTGNACVKLGASEYMITEGAVSNDLRTDIPKCPLIDLGLHRSFAT